MSFDYQQIGLDNRDIRVYETLLTLPKASLRAIALATGLNRGTVYETVKKLTQLGLASFYETGKQRHYVAQDPSVIVELVKERQRQLAASLPDAGAFAASLHAMRKQFPTAASFATFYEDDEGIATILRDVLSTTRTLTPKQYCTISSSHVREYMYHNFPSFTRQRIKEGIYVRVVAAGRGGEPTPASERKWLPEAGGTLLNSYTLIYGPKTAFITLDEHNAPFGIVIANPGITALQQTLFDHIWQQL